MAPSAYAYSERPTRNPLRYLAAVWRLIRSDPAESTDDAAIVEMGFIRSRFGRRFARWDETLGQLKQQPLAREALARRQPFGPIDLAALEMLPEGTLGRVFADHCRNRNLDPNLVHVPPTDDVGWMLNHLYQTHDIWHVVSGWGNDLEGEVGLGHFYCGQLGSPAFFGYMMALILLNVVWRRSDLGAVLAASAAGYRAGRRAEPMFGTDWSELWPIPIDEVRRRFAIDRSEIVGQGIPEKVGKAA
jgi:ubiquinone biosynthesis protein Coq4